MHSYCHTNPMPTAFVFIVLMMVAPCALASPAPYAPFTFPNIAEDKTPLRIEGPAGDIFTFVRTGADTCGKYLLAKTVIPPGAGPPPHIHHWTDEWFYTPQGGITVFMGHHRYSAVSQVPGTNAPKEALFYRNMRPGELIYGPRDYMHGFINTTDRDQVLYLVWTKDTPDVSILSYFKSVGRILKADDLHPTALDPLSKLRYVSEAPQYGIDQSPEFWTYVRSLAEETEPMASGAKDLAALLQPSSASCDKAIATSPSRIADATSRGSP